MTMSRRGFISSLSVTAMALSAASCSSDDDGADGTTKIRFGYIEDYNGASLLAIADAQGLWKKHGLSASIKTFVNGPIQIQALGTGNLDYGYIGPGALWLPASGKAKVVAIDTLTFADRVIAQPGITSVAGLKGKKVGVPEGTSGEMVLNLALQKAGLKPGDITKVAMEPATIVSAFASGQIDGAGIWYPLLDTIKQKVPKLVEVASTEDIGGNFPTAFVSGTKVSEETDEKVVKVLAEANDWRAAHPDQSIAVAAKLLKVPADKVKSDASHVRTLSTADLVAKTKDGTVAQWLDGMSDFFVGTGQLKKAPAADSFYTAGLFTRAAGK